MSDQVISSCEINNFTDFLENSLKRKVINYSLKYLTKPGDNYGSIIRSLDVKVGRNDSDKSDVLHLVCKTAITNPYLIEIFQPGLTFVKETHFYSDIIPAIESFEESAKVPHSERIDAFIPCAGFRISLDPDADCADSDAILLLENMKIQNYVNEDRQIGFDAEGTMPVLKSLAQFHALCIAVRRLNRNLFDTRINPFIKAVNLFPDDDDFRHIDTLLSELSFVENMDTELRSKIATQFEVCDKFGRNTIRIDDTPYTTVVHRDLWTNNIMVRRDAISNNIVDIKIYDFQLYFYESFVCDLIFFLCTSVRCYDLRENFHVFIRQYHSEFTKTLKRVKCPLHDYSFEKMWNEIREKSKIELLHILFMSKVCMADEKVATSIDEYSPEIFLKEDKPAELLLNRWKCIIDLYRDNKFI